MKKQIVLVLLFCIVCFATSCSRQPAILKIPDTKEDIKFSPVKPTEWQMSNGLNIVYVEDKELPIVRGALYIPRGSLWETSDRQDIVSAMGYLLRQGGTTSMDPDQLDFTLEKLAASVESGYSGEFGSVGFSCLNSDFKEVFSIFSDVLLHPQFDQSRLDLWKGQMLEGIRRRTDDPSTVASISYKNLVFGDTILGRTTISSDLKKIKREDLLLSHKKYLVPSGAYLAIVGDISREELESALNKYLSEWQNETKTDNFKPEYSYQPEPGIYFVEQPLEQATIYIGQQGPARLPPDYMEIEAFNNIFGTGDFGARLFRKIRTELGLAYSLYGAIMPSFLVGQNIIVLQTKSDSASQSAIESLKILKEMQSDSVTDEELDLSKKAIKNSYIFKVDTPDDAVKRYILLKLYDYPANYDEIYFDKVNQVTVEDIRKTATKHWDLNKLVIVVVGNQKAYNSFKKDLDNSEYSMYNLNIKKCSFEEVLGKCI